MANRSKGEAPPQSSLAARIGSKEARKLRSQHFARHGVWSGLAGVGLIGWSIALPMLVGIAVGAYIDRHQRGEHSWVLILMAIGLLIGCLNVWHWVREQHDEIRREEEG